ncbi:unnamed protein product [Menidia menidia]|uniref:(Atlantic silverside) hypothetical protein n=1 Tax=Menidia menidia TaxID=238744 RepID=A0A8S4BIL4_9TELE|nr:unnamed protein product [Menidia menidia]
MTGSVCKISHLYPLDSGVYWCEFGGGAAGPSTPLTVSAWTPPDWLLAVCVSSAVFLLVLVLVLLWRRRVQRKPEADEDDDEDLITFSVVRFQLTTNKLSRRAQRLQLSQMCSTLP